METFTIKNNLATSAMQKYLNTCLTSSNKIYYQLPPEELISLAIENGEGVLSDTGALVINTGEFTGRSPKDRFIVEDEVTSTTIDWNNFNQPIDKKCFDLLLKKMLLYIQDKKLWIRDCYACAKPGHRLNFRIVNENPCCNLFAYNMFLRPAKQELDQINIDWHLIQLPHFLASPKSDGVKRNNFVILNFTEKIILIGGTQYTGEMKKAVFSILNFILPYRESVLSMHCAANIGEKGDTAVFFGLSGTGKTTLSADSSRKLIGDDEHGWDDDSIFNCEGGCYAKTINLEKEKEPEIFNAIRFGSMVENATFITGTKIIDFTNGKITENTRASYPIDYISNAVTPSIGSIPKNIFFLTADAYGILPPISKLSTDQAIYYYLSGYTAKVAGTETGIIEPTPTFSACFGAPFLPLFPVYYAIMLNDKIKKHSVRVWLINTGWYGGSYGIGERMKLEYTRAMIRAAVDGSLDEVAYHLHGSFGILFPAECPGIPAGLLNPEASWNNKKDYYETANRLAGYFIKNFEKYSKSVTTGVLQAGPRLTHL